MKFYENYLMFEIIFRNSNRQQNKCFCKKKTIRVNVFVWFELLVVKFYISLNVSRSSKKRYFVRF